MDLFRKSGWLSNTDVLDRERKSFGAAEGEDEVDVLRAEVYLAVMLLRLAGAEGAGAGGGIDLTEAVGEAPWDGSCGGLGGEKEVEDFGGSVLCRNTGGEAR